MNGMSGPTGRAPRLTVSSDRWLRRTLASGVLAALAFSAIAPHDRFTWVLEALPLFVGLPLLVLTYPRFPLSTLLYLLLAVQGLGLVAGAHYGFARVPPGLWLQDWLELSRNPYDRIGHFVQGMVPALLTRELLLRLSGINGRRLLPFLCFCVAMTLSAVYELIEWGAALAFGSDDVSAFLGTQGDRWDSQADMFCALLGALTALILLPRWHDRSLARLPVPTPRHA